MSDGHAWHESFSSPLHTIDITGLIDFKDSSLVNITVDILDFSDG
jgi:hypothetical protein